MGGVIIRQGAGEWGEAEFVAVGALGGGEHPVGYDHVISAGEQRNTAGARVGEDGGVEGEAVRGVEVVVADDVGHPLHGTEFKGAEADGLGGYELAGCGEGRASGEPERRVSMCPHTLTRRLSAPTSPAERER